MKIAVIGAGFSGLAICWHLLSISDDVEIDLFDSLPIGEGTSGNSTGLLHPHMGRFARKGLYADEGIQEAKRLLEIAQKESKKPLAYHHGVYRPALTKEQENAFFTQANKYDRVHFWTKEKAREVFHNLVNLSGIFIEDGITVHPKKYLLSFWSVLKRKNIRFKKKKVFFSDLSSYDRSIFTTGHHLDFLQRDLDVCFEKIKGQMLVCKWPDGIPKMPMSICAEGHVSMFEDFCYLGSTYEYSFTDANADEKAMQLISQIKRFFPKVQQLEILEKRAGIRLKRKGNYFPLIHQLDKTTWLFTALGSRGLIYHGMLAKRLAMAILHQDHRYIPKESLCYGS